MKESTGEPGDPPESGGDLDELPELTHSMELVQEVQGGNRDAINELFERYKPRLRRIVRIKMGARLERYLEAEDILQEVYMVAMQKIDDLELRSQASILQWLAKIAENRIRSKLDYLHAQKRSPDRLVRLNTEGPVRVSAGEPSPSQRALRNEFQNLIDSYVEELDPTDFRDVILERDYYCGDWEQVRDRLDRPTVPAVQELYRRAHIKLREKMRRHLER